ncbi:squamosa promoter-binding-like protein 1 [Heracleum sosnowskyi]|uniref:Squamosa promoter-binding-like protein 1 n=1 Tax=Heracleum sosnowskyi TaxID=360622 RepID=A0AAD8MUS6_9APIA|nr:squamosa promoter-binding-like protein 1 [Heracleum sosnowskyi]
MEDEFRGKAPQSYGSAGLESKAEGKKKVQWNLNDWNWDGDMFAAAPSDCMTKQLFPSGSGKCATTNVSVGSALVLDESNVRDERGMRELEKRKRVVVVEDDEVNDELGFPVLKLGEQVFPVTEEEMENREEKNGKKTKIATGVVSNRALCQVEDCRADLSTLKDYHRRHKVCDVHSKANRALVKNAMQRFCQKCSRFHVLQEFDEGKRSCRRRLEGHNRRRRKTHSDNATNGISLDEERTSSYLLKSLLRILSNMHANSSHQTEDKDLLSYIFSNFASLSGTINQRTICGVHNESQDLQDGGTSIKTQGQDSSKSTLQSHGVPASGLTQKRVNVDVAHDENLSAQKSCASIPLGGGIPAKTNYMQTSVGRMKLHNIDLNYVCNDSEDCTEKLENFDAQVQLTSHQDSDKASQHQSGNSGSTSIQSLPSSSVEALSCTDQIVFKLFGHDPSGIPSDLRCQLLAWLENTPTEMESYIRPGCIMLTVYLRMEKSTWKELCCNIRFGLRKLLDSSSNTFWKTGWIYARLRHRVAFVYDGQVVLDTPLLLKNDRSCKIFSIKPIAVSASEEVRIVVKGSNIARSNTRLLCALEGKYLVQEDSSSLIDGAASFTDNEEEIQSISFLCSIPDVIGRGFIEVEDQGLRNSFFPFIVAEPDVCSEIRTLESTIEDFEATVDVKGDTERCEARTRALDFLHELGWLLHRNHLKFRLSTIAPKQDFFPFTRFRFILEFSLDHDWCVVVKKLLDILFGGNVDAGEHTSVELALLEICLLHKAAWRNCRPMVEALLIYDPENVVDKFGSEQKHTSEGRYFFRPDAVGPGGLTPLHIAACRDGSESILDALTDDPHLVGIEAWITSRDCTGLTPHDYACQSGHYSYIHIVQTKIKKISENRHVVVDIPTSLLDGNKNWKLADGRKFTEVGSLETEKCVMRIVQTHCGLCEQKLSYGNYRTSQAFCRPAMLLMVVVATVAACVTLFFKSSPMVHGFQAFRWEFMEYGPC